VEGARLATDADLPQLSAMAAEAVAEQAASRGGAVWSRREARPVPAEPSLRAALADPGRLVLVGTVESTVVGYAVAHVEALRDGERLGVIDDVFVLAGAREVGVGEALVESVLTWCREQGCRGVDALALPGNRHTKNFFESFGFTARAIVVHRPLDGDR
jgi:GNAT superfamily N-acetyltransferase